MCKRIASSLVLSLLVTLEMLSQASVALAAESSVLRPAIPLDPSEAIIDAFDSYRVVALDEGDHGNEQGHALRMQLIRDRRLPKVVNDIVVEFGTAQYQNEMDRYIAGEDVPYQVLRRAWEDTATAWTTWDVPIYQEFFRAVRDVNRKLPADRRLRVLLGDKPIDWSVMHSWDDFRKHARTDEFPAALIQREVIAKNRRALVIYAGAHFTRKNLYWPLTNREEAERRFNAPVKSIVTLLEAAGTKVFSIGTLTSEDLGSLEPDVAKWTKPKLAILRGTRLGARSVASLGSHVRYIMVDREKGIEERVVADPQRSPTMQDQYDAVIYMGAKSSITYSRIAPELCADADYLAMRLKRITLASPWDKDPGSGLKKHCAALANPQK
jgi:hypothetical protein